MRLARKLFLLAAMALAALAMTASTVSAQVEVIDEESVEVPQDHCAPVVVGPEHETTGGCHIEYQSTGEVPLFANVPGVGVVQLSNCEVHLEAQIGEDGNGYITTALLTGHPAPSFPCTRTPCDEPAPDHEELLWPIQLEEAAGAESIEATFCLRPSANAEGNGNTPCTVHLEVADLGGHNYEIGHSGGVEAHCEPDPFVPFDVWIENAHLINENDPMVTVDDAEIIH